MQNRQTKINNIVLWLPSGKLLLYKSSRIATRWSLTIEQYGEGELSPNTALKGVLGLSLPETLDGSVEIHRIENVQDGLNLKKMSIVLFKFKRTVTIRTRGCEITRAVSWNEVLQDTSPEFETINNFYPMDTDYTRSAVLAARELYTRNIFN